MEYNEVKNLFDKSIDLFFDHMESEGLTRKQTTAISERIDNKDGFNSLLDSMVEELCNE